MRLSNVKESMGLQLTGKLTLSSDRLLGHKTIH